MPVFIEEFTLAGSGSGPYALTTGPDGALWFTLVHSGGIGRLVPGGILTHHQLDPDCGPTIIAVGPDDALWFTEHRAHRIGRITLDGKVEEFTVPTAKCGPFGIAAGPDGALWFTETAADRIGRITTDGRVTEFQLPATGATPPRSPQAPTTGCGSP